MDPLTLSLERPPEDVSELRHSVLSSSDLSSQRQNHKERGSDKVVRPRRRGGLCFLGVLCCTTNKSDNVLAAVGVVVVSVINLVRMSVEPDFNCLYTNNRACHPCAGAMLIIYISHDKFSLVLLIISFSGVIVFLPVYL